MGSLAKEIEKHIVKDSKHGSSELLNLFYELVAKHADVATEDLEQALDQLKNVNSAMHIVHHFVKSLNQYDNPELLSAIHRYRQQWEYVTQEIAGHLLEHYDFKDSTILTHSRSGTIQEVMRWMGPPLHIIQTKSIPGEEGSLQAEDLTNWGFDVQLINDEEVKELIDQVDYCFIGCDQYDDDCMVNKVGSSEMIALANQENVPVFILTDSRKKVAKVTTIESPFEVIVITKSMIFITEEGIDTTLQCE